MNYGAPYKGNFMQTLLCLEERLKDENIETVYLFFKATAEAEWAALLMKEGKKIYFLSGNKLKDLFLISHLIKKYEIGIVHTHFIGVVNIFFLRMIIFFGNKRCLIVRHLHSPLTVRNSLVEYLKKTFAHVDLSIGCSKAVGEDYNAKKKDKKERVVYATNAIDYSRLDRYEILNREDMGIKKDHFVLLVFGYNYFLKGIDVVVNAVSELVKEHTQIYLVISLADNTTVAEHEIKKKFGQIPEWIKLVRPRNDIATYYRSADAFISSSRSEGFCYSLVEAAYCGTQVIASEIFAQKDLNIPFTFRYAVEDVAELKRQILSAMSVSPDERIRRAKIQKDYVVHSFDLHKWAETVVKFYQYYFVEPEYNGVKGKRVQSAEPESTLH
jgi:glycosyltransferase involved in cell wall biosynthesis